jgi:hypothetical protein
MTKEAQQAAAAMVNKRAAQRHETLAEIRRLIQEIDHGAALRMDVASSGRVPSAKQPDRQIHFLAEAVLALAKQSRPRKPGRPRKDAS